MWNILVLSLLASAVFVQSKICEKTDDECRPGGQIMPPSTAEELGIFCGQAIDFLECALAIRNQCDPVDGFTADEITQLIPIGKQICNNETDLYKDLEASVSCLHSNIYENRDLRCFEMMSNAEVVEKFEKLLEREGITDLPSEDSCFRPLFMDTCFFARIGVKCGATARNAIITIGEMVRVVKDHPCNSHLNEKWSVIREAMEIEYMELEESEKTDTSSLAPAKKCGRLDEVCLPHGEIAPPSTPEELGVRCEQAIEFLECSIASLTECDVERRISLEEIRSLLPIAKTICNKETALYKNLEASVSCLHTNIIEDRDMYCFAMSSSTEVVEKLEKVLEREGLTDITSEDSCFHRLLSDTCFLARIGVKCGATARDVLIDIAEMATGVMENPCHNRLNGKMPVIVKTMEIEYLEPEETNEV